MKIPHFTLHIVKNVSFPISYGPILTYSLLKDAVSPIEPVVAWFLFRKVNKGGSDLHILKTMDRILSRLVPERFGLESEGLSRSPLMVISQRLSSPI
jgi:hypothetical protein